MSIILGQNKILTSRKTALWAPALLLVILLVLFGLLARNMEQKEQNRLTQATMITGQQVELRLEAWIDDRVSIVAHYADHLRNGHLYDEHAFKLEAKQLFTLYPGFQALNYIDRDWIIRDVYPEESNQAALGKDLHLHPAEGVREAILKSMNDKQICRTPLIELLQGGVGFATYAPIFVDGELTGFVNGVFMLSHLVDGCLSENNLRDNYAMALYASNGKLAYSHQWSGKWDLGGRAFKTDIRIVDKDLELRLAPTEKALLQSSTSADEFMVAIGVVLALVLAIVLRVLMIRQVDLSESREKYRLLVENQADMVLKIGRDGEILFTSPAFYNWMHLNEESVTGSFIWQYILREDHRRTRESMRNLRHPPYKDQLEIRIATPEGVCWTSWAASAIIDADGEFQGFIGVGRDISRRMELEEQLRRSQKLQAVGQLAGGIAHDFNNIIQAIKGYLGFVQSDLPQDSRSYQDISEASRAADRAVALTKQLLAFSRRQVLQPINLELNVVIKDTLSMLRTLLGEAVELRFDPGKSLGVVKADRGQIEQILMNLCVNSRDAFEGGNGAIVISTSNQHLDENFCKQHIWASPGDYVKMSVTDNGSGMSEDVQKRIFDPFYTTKSTGKGTGLGLATVYGIAKQHNGYIQAESQLGQGTVMSVYLPIVAGEVETIVAGETRLQKVGNETILLVEDEDMVRNVAVRILDKAGYQVIEAKNGNDALEIYGERKDEIDLVFMDIVMPGLSGRDVCKQIYQDTAGVRILLTSGYDSELFTRHNQEFPHQPLLPKPYSKEELLTAIRELLSSQSIIYKS
jgi:PAS domain S-box-containing protein